jgi:hypothetical protein
LGEVCKAIVKKLFKTSIKLAPKSSQIVHQIEIKPTGEGYVLNTSNWPSGLYQYRLIKSNETIGSGKIMIAQ